MKIEPQIEMETNTDKLIKVAQKALDTDVTPLDNVPDRVACAESVSTLIKKVLPEFPIIASTADLYVKLKQDKRFKAVLNPVRGAIVISPRTATVNGHTGIFITNERIASNNSSTGLFQGNYFWNTWIDYFIHKRGLRVYLFLMV
jgi:hypothetical protein